MIILMGGMGWDGMGGWWDGKPFWLQKCAKKCSRMILKIWSGVA